MLRSVYVARDNRPFQSNVGCAYLTGHIARGAPKSTMKRARQTKGDKMEVRREMHLTRPPRLEGKVKEAMMQPVRKKKKRAG